ncbi:MAG TPA: putative Ig domain-containing protein [Dyadobacter sp.]|jgi:hypothetical protein|nr:putative Ig domain-containing protein [Dyadobacter sp.]
MKKSTRLLNILKVGTGGLLAALFAFSPQQAKAQTKTYLTGQKTGDFYNTKVVGVGGAEITAPIARNNFYYGTTSVLTGSTTASTTMKATDLSVVAGLAGANVYLLFRNDGNANIVAGTPVYFKLGAKPVTTGINVNVSTVLGLSSIYNISGSAYKNAGNYTLPSGFDFSGNANEGNAIVNNDQTTTKLLIDKNNDWHAAVTPPASEPFNAVRLNVAVPTGLKLVAASSVSTNVHNAFTVSTGDPCSVRPLFTGFGNTGITVTTESVLGGLDLGQLVADAHLAIDDSPATYSKFSNGLANVGVANTIAQEIIFDHTASASDAAKIHFSLNQSIVALDLLSGGVTFKAYKGPNNVAVATQSLQDNLNLIGLNLANILTINSGFVDVNTTFKPGVEFDRIEVSFNGGLINANVIGDALRLYDVELSAVAPSISSTVSLGANNSLTVYAGAQLPAITATSAGNNILWYLGNSATALTPGSASPYNLPVTSIATAGDYVYYAAAQKEGCTNISAKVPVNIKVLPVPTFTNPGFLVEGVAYTGTGKSITVTGGQTGSTYNFTGVSLTNLTNAGLDLGIDGRITGTPIGTFAQGGSTITFTATVTDGALNNIPVVVDRLFSITVYPKVIANPVVLPSGIRTQGYTTTSIAATGGSGTFTYALTGTSGPLPTGLTLNADGSISGTTTGAAGVYPITVLISDPTSGQTVEKAYSITIYDPLVANPATLPESYVSAPSYGASAIPAPTGGSGAGLTYAVQGANQLPTGLTLNANGTITGTTTADGTYTFTVRITDATANTFIDQTYTVIVYKQLLIPGGNFPSVMVSETSYMVDIADATITGISTNGSATGGKAPFTYSLTNPVGRTLAVPTGFSLSPQGVLTGNPNAAGISVNSFTIYVTDALQQVASNTYTLTIETSLPVKLTSFKVTKEGESAQLSWSTTSESNSESFEVQRSRDGKEWNAIGSRDAKGESAALVTYSFTDANPLDGENLYRLKMIDRDATFSMSGIQSIRFAIESLKLYPNPVANAEPLTIQVQDWGLVKSVKVFNTVGKIVFESAGDIRSTVTTENLTAGLYIVQVTRKDGQVMSSKFVKR